MVSAGVAVYLANSALTGVVVQGEEPAMVKLLGTAESLEVFQNIQVNSEAFTCLSCLWVAV